ncbi:MAG: efflux RND transporter periplasmic adaptor subunit [Wenzhouxiangella sp.]|nr:MAG: efflux RND transporter periplasmic adaptor subunit [Wenzhouxiangella sp.]
MQRFSSLILVLLVVVLAACSNGNSQGPLNGESETVRIPVEVSEAQLGTISAFYSATATLEADGEAKVVARISGRIIEILAEEGDRVQAGDVLARIDDDRLRLELARAEADLSRLRQDFNRQREMHQRNLIATEVFERIQFEYQAQQTQVELVRLELSYADVTAPIDGVVSERMVRVGNMVNTTDPVFVVTAMEPILATLHVPERELARLQPGQLAMLQVDALPGQPFAGRIARISPVVDAASGTFRVTVELSDHGQRLRPGMFGRFNIVYDSRDQAVLIPVAAVMSEDGRHSVFVVDASQAQRRAVTLGYRNNGQYEIVEGLEPGERVVVTGQASLRTGTEVLVLGETAEPEPESTDPEDAS